MKNLILCTRVYPTLLLLFYKIFVRRLYIKNRSVKYNIVPEDLFTASDYRKCDHDASNIKNKVNKKIINKSDVKFLTKWGTLKYTDYLINKKLHADISSILQAYKYAEKVCKINEIKDIVYIWPKKMNFRVYEELIRLNLLSDKIKVLPLAKIYIQSINFIRFVYHLAKSFAYPEISLLMANNSISLKKTKYKIALHMDDGLANFEIPPDKLFIDDKYITKEDILFINDRKQPQKWEIDFKKNNYNILKTNDLIKHISKKSYLNNIYNKVYEWRKNIVINMFRYPWLSGTLSNSLRQRNLWEIFYLNYGSNKTVRLMTEEDLTSSIAHKKNKSKTFFIYFSTTEKIIKTPLNDMYSSCNEYTHMISDYIVSSKISNEWIQTLECSIGEYKNLGPLFADCAINAKATKDKYYKLLDVPTDAKIISFIDHTVGDLGVLTIDAYNKFLQSLVKLTIEYPNFYFLLKTKKNFNDYKKLFNKETMKLLSKIDNHKRCRIVNKLNISSYQTIGISDIVISAPMSSITHESYFSGVKTISYDPEHQYKGFPSITRSIKHCNATNHDELKSSLDYWLTEVSDEEYVNFLKEHIEPKIGNKCGKGETLKETRNFLCELD